MESVAPDGKRGNFLNRLLDSRNAGQVSGSVLRHCAAPSVNAHKSRLRVEPKNLPQFSQNRCPDLLIAEVDGCPFSRATQKTSQETFICWRAMRELVVNERAGAHAPVLRAWHQESESGRQLR